MFQNFTLINCAQKLVIPRLPLRQQALSNVTLKCQKTLNIMFFGTDDFALKSLVKLHAELLNEGCVKGLEVTCLETKNLEPIVAKYARKNNLRIHLWPPDIDHIQNSEFDLGVVASFGKLIPSTIISSFPLGIVNVHGSLLPKWRGAAPVIHSLLNGDESTGVTIMKIKPKKFDTGEILAAKEVSIDEDVRRPELTTLLAETGAELLVDVLRNYEHYNKRSQNQNCEGVTHAPLVKKSIGYVDWEALSNVEVYNLWRAVGDFMKLRTTHFESGASVRIGVVLAPRKLLGLNLGEGDFGPGSIVFIRRSKKERHVCVKCRTGWISISDIYYHNKKVMSPLDFYNGVLSKPGCHKFIKT